MKNAAIVILFAATVAFGGLYFQQVSKSSQAQTDTAALQQKVTELQTSLDDREKQTAKLKTQLETTRTEAMAKIREAVQIGETLQASLSNQTQRATVTPETNAGPANMFSEMFKDPKMKEFIKSQQKVALGTMIDKNYGRFFKDMNLTPEQTSSLKDMILNKQLAAADAGMSMFADAQDPAKRADMVQQIKTSSEAADEEIKNFLGDDNFAQYQTYEKSLGERMVVSGLKDQLGGGSSALTDDQEQQLVSAMTQERQNFKFTTDLSDKATMTGDFSQTFSEDKVNTFAEESGRLNQQYLARAQSILSPDQFTAFQDYLNNQQAMQKMGMQMAAKMFAPAKSGGN